MQTTRFAAVLAGVLALASPALAQDGAPDATSATPAIQIENATKLFDQFIALESAWDPAIASLYMDDAVVDRTMLSAGEPELKSFTAEQYKAILPEMFTQMKAGGAAEAWSNVKVLYDGPARTLVTADLVITANGAPSSTSKVQIIIFDMIDGPMQVTSDVRTVAAPGYTPPADEAQATVDTLNAALATLDSAAIAAMLPDDVKIIQVELGLDGDGDELSRVEQSRADFLADVETEFAALRAVNGNGRFIVYENYKNEDGTWYVRGETILASTETHDAYNTWGDALTLVKKDGAWTVGTYLRSFRHAAD